MTTENETPDTGAEETDETVDNDEALLTAISDAIDEETDPSLLEKDDDDETDAEAGETDTDRTPAGESGTEDEADAEESADGESEDEDAAADDAEAGTSEGDDDATEDSSSEGSDETASDDAAGTADPINDPIPESTNEKTATRIRSLIEIAKENTSHAGERDELITAITNTGADPEQYTATLGFLSLYNSDDPTQRKQALEAARGIVRELSIELGEGSQDLLGSHEDLQAEVEAGTLDEKRAIEIATGREKTALTESRTKAANEKQEVNDQTQALITTGKEQLDTFETGMKTDPDYVRLRPLFIESIKPALRNTHPTQWGETAKNIFAQLKIVNPAPAAPAPKPAPPNTPLRPKQGAGGGSDKEGEPTDALAAVNDALASL